MDAYTSERVVAVKEMAKENNVQSAIRAEERG